MSDTETIIPIEWNCVECDATGTLILDDETARLDTVLFKLHKQHTVQSPQCPTLTGEKNGVLKLAIWPEEVYT